MMSKLGSRRDEEAKEDAVDTRSRQEEGASAWCEDADQGEIKKPEKMV